MITYSQFLTVTVTDIFSNIKIFIMKQRPEKAKNKQNHLYRGEIPQPIDMNHEIVKIAHSINWDDLEESLGEFYSKKTGPPAIGTRLIVVVSYLNTF